MQRDVLQDDRVAVAALWQPSLLWTAPAWLTTAAAQSGSRAAHVAAVNADQHGTSSTETSSSSGTHADGGSSSGDGADGAASDDSEPGDRGATRTPRETQQAPRRNDTANTLSSRDSSSSDSSSDGDDSASPPSQLQQMPADMFGELDMAFATASGRHSRRRAPEPPAARD